VLGATSTMQLGLGNCPVGIKGGSDEISKETSSD
jgi:hypothetical protein